MSCSAPHLHEACQCRHVALALPEVRGQEAGQQCQVHLWQRVLVQLNQLRKDLEDVGVELLQQGAQMSRAPTAASASFTFGRLSPATRPAHASFTHSRTAAVMQQASVPLSCREDQRER